MSMGRKDKALLLLRKKKYTEKILVRTDNELANVERIIMDIEYKQVETNVLKGMEIGNECLKQLNAVFSIEQIEELLDDTTAAVEKQREIDSLLSGSGKEQFDEDELSAELNSILGVEEEKEEEPEVVQKLPEVPAEIEEQQVEEEPEEEKERPAKKAKKKEERIALEA